MRLLLLLLALWPLAALPAGKTASQQASTPAGKVATRIWYAGDGQGGLRVLWFLPPERWGHGWRLEDHQGRILADRIVPEPDFKPGDKDGALLLGMRVLGDWELARKAGLAAELKDLPTQRTRLTLRRLDARGQPDGAYLTTGNLDPGLAAPLPKPPRELSAEATPQCVKLYWRPQPGRLPVLAYTVERDDGRNSTRLTQSPLLLGNQWPQPSAAFVDAKAPAEREVGYRVRALDSLGRASLPATVRLLVPDFTALAPPRGLTANSPRAPIRLAWEANASANTKGYMVERAFQTGGPWEVMTPLGTGQETRYTDREARPGSTVFYRLRAIGPRGDFGAPCLPLPVNVRGDPPASPANLAAEVGNTRVRLTWHAATGAAAYHLERRAGDARAWSRLTTTPTPELRYDDIYGGSPGGRFEYRVYAVAPDQQTGEPSAVLTVALLDTQSPPPPQVVASSGESGRVRLAFRAAAPEEDTIQVLVLRAATAEEQGVVIGDPLPVARGEFVDTWVDAGKTYVYRLVAVDTAGNRSDPGVAVQVRVGAPPLGVPERPQAQYLAEPFPHVKLSFKAPPKGLRVLVEAGDGAQWRPAAGPVVGNEAIDVAPQRATPRYRLRYQSAQGGQGEASPEVLVALP